MILPVNPCLICGSREAECLFDLDFIPVNEGRLKLMRCPRCGFEYLFPPPEAEEAVRMYDRKYYEDGYLKYSEVRVRQFEHFFRHLRELNILRPSSGQKVLDIGAGAGFFLHVLKQNRVEGTGIEPSASARTIAAERFGISIKSRLEEIGKEEFDLITFWDVLGHIVHPAAYLDFCRGRLRKNGSMVIKFPNFQSLRHRFNFYLARKFRINTLHAPTIIWRFSRRTIGQILRKSGFEVFRDETVQPAELPLPDGWKLRIARQALKCADHLFNNRQDRVIYARLSSGKAGS